MVWTITLFSNPARLGDRVTLSNRQFAEAYSLEFTKTESFMHDFELLLGIGRKVRPEKKVSAVYP